MTLFLEDYQALPAGHRWTSPGRTVNESDITLFGGLTGDLHPLHTDAEAARAGGYGERIAHGYLTASLAAGLAYRIGLDEGSSFALLNIEWRFRQPVHIGDTIRVGVELLSARPSRSHPGRGVVLRRYEVQKQSGEVVAVGQVAMLCNRRPVAPPTGQSAGQPA